MLHIRPFQAAAPSALAVAVCAAALLAAPGAWAQGRQAKWQGVYIGAHAGGAIGRTAPVNTSGLAAGVQLGVNGQFDRVVAGVEADVGTTTARHTGFGTKFSQGANGTIRGRLGYSFDRVMVYGTLGGAVSNFSASTPVGRASRTRTGTVFGAGAEVMLTDSISARAEYLRYNYGRTRFPTGAGPVSSEPVNNVLRGGVNYHF
jgi:outer membrane immunogenic protein